MYKSIVLKLAALLTLSCSTLNGAASMVVAVNDKTYRVPVDPWQTSTDVGLTLERLFNLQGPFLSMYQGKIGEWSYGEMICETVIRFYPDTRKGVVHKSLAEREVERLPIVEARREQYLADLAEKNRQREMRNRQRMPAEQEAAEAIRLAKLAAERILAEHEAAEALRLAKLAAGGGEDEDIVMVDAEDFNE